MRCLTSSCQASDKIDSYPIQVRTQIRSIFTLPLLKKNAKRVLLNTLGVIKHFEVMVKILLLRRRFELFFNPSRISLGIEGLTARRRRDCGLDSGFGSYADQ